jgi:hypothetical protein
MLATVAGSAMAQEKTEDINQNKSDGSVTAKLGETVTQDVWVPVSVVNEKGAVETQYILSTVTVRNVVEQQKADSTNTTSLPYVNCYANNHDWYGWFTGGIRWHYQPGGSVGIVDDWKERHEVNTNGARQGWSTNGYNGGALPPPYQWKAIQKGFFYNNQSRVNRTHKIRWEVYNNGSCRAWISRY